LTSELPVLENPAGMTLEGNGNTVDGGSTSATTGYRVFFIGVSSDIAAVSPSLTATTSTDWAINHLLIQHGNARGGDGGNGSSGGGGGAGLGGAIFVNAGQLALTDVTFAGNQANGGSGGSALSLSNSGGGGGGGMSGQGGSAVANGRSGGGGGGFGSSATGGAVGGSGQAGLFLKRFSKAVSFEADLRA
jgi:hypothetical protein